MGPLQRCYPLAVKLLRQALEDTASGPACLATVIRTSGSTPRHPGAKMLIFEDGTAFGTIGGGRVELEVMRAGAEVAGGAAARRVTHHLVRDLAMCCGGTMELYLEPLAPSIEVLGQALEAVDQRRPVDLVTDLGGGPKTLRRDADPSQRAAILEGELFVERLRATERALIFGCGHVGRALGPVLASVGFEVVVCDDDETGALNRELPWASATCDTFHLPDVTRSLGELGAGDYLVILTRDHAIDQDIVERALPHGAKLGYLGLIGSRGKIARFKKRLFAKGVADADSWARLRAPIGIDIGAETPEEIAVSVAAELISVRAAARRGERGDGRGRP